VWTRNPKAERLSSYADYVSDPAVRREAWRGRLGHPAWSAQPNQAHQALVTLEKTGRLRAVVTQNVDGLHQRAGSDPASVIELHGTIWFSECVACRDRRPMEETLERVRRGDADPSCERCGGIVKSATISFGQALDPDVISAGIEAAADCDVFLAVGTSLSVQPAAGLCDVALRSGAHLVIINAQPTPYDDVAGAVIREPIGDVVPTLFAVG
jgi:NAD-dependent deacetylase